MVIKIKNDVKKTLRPPYTSENIAAIGIFTSFVLFSIYLGTILGINEFALPAYALSAHARRPLHAGRLLTAQPEAGMAQINKGSYAPILLAGETLQTGQWINKLNWANLEPSPGVYNFSLIDDKVRPAAEAGKRVRLRIEAGDLSPAWLKDPPYNIPEYHVVPPNVPEYDTYYVWHPTYVSELSRFLSSLGAYLEGPSFPYRSSLVVVSVPAAPDFAEMITGGWSTSFLDAQDPPPAYTRAAYADAWKKAIDTMASSFPTIPLMINLSETWDEVANPTNGVPLTDWVAKEVGDYATANYPNKVEISNDSVPKTFASLVPYFQAKSSAGIAVSAQIGWNKLTNPDSDGGSTVTYDELCLAYKFAYDLGARAIDVNKNAFLDSTLRLVIAEWDPALKGTGSPPDCGADTTPPTVLLTSPLDNTTVSGNVLIEATASDNVGIINVEFYVDGALFASDTTSPYSASWDTSLLVPDSIHTIYAKAYDQANNMATSIPPIGVTVSATDSDNDGFSDYVENYIGTNRFQACPSSATADDEYSDPWPPDFNDNGKVEIDDAFFVSSRFNAKEGDANYTKRAELATQNGIIGIDDVNAASSRFGQTCQ